MPLRVCHIITRLIVGGAQENTLATCIGLKRDYGCEVDLVVGPTEGPEGTLTDAARAAGIEPIVVPGLVRPLAPDRDLSALRELRLLLRRGRYDIVHTHSAKAGILGRIAAGRERVPIVVHTIHGLPFHEYERWWCNAIYIGAERVAARYTTHFISVADAMTRKSLGAWIGRPGQYTTIYSGMDIGAFVSQSNAASDLRRHLGIAPDDFVVGKIARLFELKGHEYLLAAAPGIVKANPKVKFLLVGDGILRHHLEDQIIRLGLDRHFIFMGLVPPEEVPRYVGCMDALVHLSLREGLARALPQAMAAGKPVISFDIDGAAEVVKNEETGFLLAPRDVEALKRSVIRLLQDRNLASSMGARGRELVKEKFSQETMVRRIFDLYRHLTAPE
ncbi:MAG: glycosyltransferase family 1 protein [Verrucomicrobiae bacterium]|nr:glycosyltransferase family 1 protein [Verrucomicrobiae bacterium]